MPENPNDEIEYDGEKLSAIVLAGGCFWGTQAFIRRIPGVATTITGYANGHESEVNYRSVCTGTTGYAEAVLVGYDPSILPLGELLKWYFKTIDPTSKDGQGGDVGDQYRTGIFYSDENDLAEIEKAVKEEQKNHKKPIVTEVLPLTAFIKSEEYHQDYLEKNPNGYCHVDLSMLGRNI